MSDITTVYWAHRDAFRIAFGIGAVLLAQTVLMLWVVRRLDELSHLRERISRLADGLALLTDTTEAGMATLARELQQQSRKPAAAPRSSSRSAVSRRVVAASRRGQDPAAIAGQEALSESEVRLHLKLAQARQPDTAGAVQP